MLAQELLALISEDPYRRPHPFERRVGDLAGTCSHRINIQHRLVYQVLEDEQVEFSDSGVITNEVYFASSIGFFGLKSCYQRDAGQDGQAGDEHAWG